MTKMLTQACRWVLALVILASGSSAAFAQTDQGRFSGVVRDQTGAVVPGATVTVTNQATGEVRTTVSTDKGVYVVTPLKPAMYTLKIEKAGFGVHQLTDLPLAVGQDFNYIVDLRPAGMQEAVTVTADIPVIDVSSARMGVNVTPFEIQNLPINGRQMSQMLLQAPGAINSGTGTWQDIRFSGRAVEQNAIRYDGIEGSAIIDAAPGNLNGEVPTPFKLQASIENVQEFRVESNSYPAEYGTGTGGQINVVTKSGTNRFRGSLFEYYRNDRFDAPNYFDKTAGLSKSPLKQHQNGGSIGGPLAQNRAFFFGSVEAYRLQAGINAVEAVPSAAAWARAVPAIAPLRAGFLAPGAVILPGASKNPDFDIAQLQSVNDVNETAASGRVDVKLTPNWSAYVRAYHDRGRSTQPEGVSGRVVEIRDDPSNAVFSLQGLFGSGAVNELKVGYNAAPSNIVGNAPTINGVDFSRVAINLSGSVANNGIAGQGSSSGVTTVGGLVRSNSATNGHAQPYDPYSLTLANALTLVRGNHNMKFGGEFRVIRMTTDRIGGTTYTFAGLPQFLANQPQSIQYLGDLSEPSVFNGGATGERHIAQEYYIAYGQSEWRLHPNFTMNVGLRYEYYTPLRETNDLIVKFNTATGNIDPNTTPLFKSRKDSVLPRVSGTWSANNGRTVLRGGFGLSVGPGQTEDQIQPVESDRISSTITSGASLAYPIDPAVLRASFVNNPNTRSYQPRAYTNDYTIPERIYQYSGSLQQEIFGKTAITVAYVGSLGRNLFLRSVTNQITGVYTNPNPANPAIVVREFSIVTARDAAGNPTAVQNPYAEIDFKTTGGHDRYDALQLTASRRLSGGLTMNAQYTLGRSYGNTAGSNEALTAANNARTKDEFEYDLGYNRFDVRHTFNVSALYALPFGRGRAFLSNASALTDALLGGWDVGVIVNTRSGLPVDVQVVRPDVVYRDAGGNIFQNPAAGRTAIINTPGGGASRNVRRPDLVPGVDPFVRDGGVLFLNPAAFATPAPGTFGNLKRGSIKGPGFKQTDLVFSKRVRTGGTSSVELRAEIFNVFDTVNFSNPVGTLPVALPTNALNEANRLQPGQPYTAAAASTFGRLTGTVSKTVGLGTPRQAQFAIRFNF